MKLYLYNKHNFELFRAVEGDIISRDSVRLADGSVMVVPDFIEASSVPDLSEKLFENMAILEPDLESRVAALEELVASIIYGGEINAQ